LTTTWANQLQTNRQPGGTSSKRDFAFESINPIHQLHDSGQERTIACDCYYNHHLPAVDPIFKIRTSDGNKNPTWLAAYIQHKRGHINYPEPAQVEVGCTQETAQRCQSIFLGATAALVGRPASTLKAAELHRCIHAMHAAWHTG
jgi:hypothetical protein